MGGYGGICCAWLYGYERVCVLVDMAAIKMVRVFEVEIKGYRMGVPS